MQPDDRHMERIGQHFGVLGMLLGLVLLVAALNWSRPSQARGPWSARRVPAGAAPEEVVMEPTASTSSQRGREGLLVYRKGARTVERLRPGAAVASGDLIQIGYAAATATHGVIISVDGRGVVTLHHPAALDRSTALEPFGRQLLPYAFELDGAPVYERILLVTANRPIDVRAVMAAGRDLVGGTATRPLLPRGLRVSDELVLKKVMRR